MKQTIIVIFLSTLIVLSCTKSDSPSRDIAPLSSQHSAARTSVTPEWVEYRINNAYATNYLHWCQLWASPLTTYERQNACGPVSYLLAAHMVAAGHGYTFMPCSGTKLRSIVDRIGSLPISMSDIYTYVHAYDKPPLTALSYSGNDRAAYKRFLESSLADGNPLIVPIEITKENCVNDSRYTSDAQTENYDLDSSPQAGRPNYIVTSKLSGSYGHFVVVIAIKVSTTTGHGFVYYKDPLSSTGATKICSYTRFLESAKINGSCSEPYCINYDALCIKKL